MPWKNNPLRLYHGTDENSATAIIHGSIDLKKCHPLTDFGRGFYTTTYLDQAKNWANHRVEILRKSKNPQAVAAVMEFDVNLDSLASLEGLVFINDAGSNDFWDFIRFNRNGLSRPSSKRSRFGVQHNRSGTRPCYDVVFGQVSLWPQSLVIKDCDQISFHTAKAINSLIAQSLQYVATHSVTGRFDV